MIKNLRIAFNIIKVVSIVALVLSIIILFLFPTAHKPSNKIINLMPTSKENAYVYIDIYPGGFEFQDISGYFGEANNNIKIKKYQSLIFITTNSSLFLKTTDPNFKPIWGESDLNSIRIGRNTFEYGLSFRVGGYILEHNSSEGIENQFSTFCGIFDNSVSRSSRERFGLNLYIISLNNDTATISCDIIIKIEKDFYFNSEIDITKHTGEISYYGSPLLLNFEEQIFNHSNYYTRQYPVILEYSTEKSRITYDLPYILLGFIPVSFLSTDFIEKIINKYQIAKSKKDKKLAKETKN